jgi:hypothetical protein
MGYSLPFNPITQKMHLQNREIRWIMRPFPSGGCPGRMNKLPPSHFLV